MTAALSGRDGLAMCFRAERSPPAGERCARALGEGRTLAARASRRAAGLRLTRSKLRALEGRTVEGIGLEKN